MKSKELKALSLEELHDKLEDRVKHLYQLRLRAVTKELEKSSDIRIGRRDIARVKQAIGEKQREAADAATAK